MRKTAALLLPVALVLLGLAARQVAGTALRAFTHYDTPFVFSPVEVPTGEPLARQVVIVLVDGLGLAASRGLPFLDELRRRGADCACHIGEPSLSLPGRAVILSGAWQEVHGQATNFNPRPVRVETLFSMARQRGLVTALAAGTGGGRLFAPWLEDGAPYPNSPETAPFATYEATLRDQAERSRALLDRVRGRPGLVMLELHAVDNVGHGWGGRSEEYRRAAALSDGVVRDLAARLDLARDTLVVTADHGHVGRGGHGGGEPDVMQVPLVLAGAGIRAGWRGECRQVDIAPTLSVLLGLSVPASSQGRPLLAALALEGDRLLQALRATVAQRERFVAAYVFRLATLGDARAATALPEPPSATIPAQAGPEWFLGRLDELDAREAEAKEARRLLETEARAVPAVVLALTPPALVGVFVLLGVVTRRELALSTVAGLCGLVLYHLGRLAFGLHYSFTAVNKDERLGAFFRSDMALGLATCALAVALAAAVERRAALRAFDLARLAWLVTAVFCWGFLVKVALVFWEQGAALQWRMGDMRWGFGFYLDVLVLMAVGVLAPLMALPAWLAGWRRRPPASPGPGLAAG